MVEIDIILKMMSFFYYNKNKMKMVSAILQVYTYRKDEICP